MKFTPGMPSVKQKAHTTAADKSPFFNQKFVNIFLISPQKHMLWYSLEVPHRGTSNEYPQHMFS